METVNWSKIKTGVGTADHISAAIKKLFSDLETERGRACFRIDNYAIIQSDLYEAAYYIIDPIMNELEKPYTVNRYYAFLVLSEIANGFAPETETIGLVVNGISEMLPLYSECMKKMAQNYERISALEVYDQNEIEEKQYLLESIEEKKINSFK